jgi:hypothetical protein
MPQPRYSVTIPNWHPIKLNELLRGGWRIAHRLKNVDREIVAYAFWSMPKAKGKRRVTMTILLAKGQRAGDPDCYWKSGLDSLVACGALKDDRRQCVELMPVKFERATRAATIITLEDIT